VLLLQGCEAEAFRCTAMFPELVTPSKGHVLVVAIAKEEGVTWFLCST